MQTYETLFITPPNLPEEDERNAVETFASVVTSGGGAMVANERMGRRRLAYPIRKFDDGIYIRFLYDSEADVPRELERRLRLSENVLRSLTVLLEQEWAESAKEQAVRDAERRATAEAEAEAAAAAAAAEAERRAAAGEDEPAAEESASTEGADPGAVEAAPAPNADDRPATDEAATQEVAPANDVAADEPEKPKE